MYYCNVKEIKETKDVAEVNQLLENGWILIEVFKPDESTVKFVLGRIK